MRVYDIINELQATNSTNKKVDILKKNRDNVVFTEILKMTYNPQLNLYVRDVELVPVTREVTTIDKDYFTYSDVFTALSKRTLTGNAARDRIRVIMSNFDVESQQIFKMIFERDLHCNIGVTLINKAFGKDFIPEFKVQLANKYSPKKKYKTDYFFATPKLDGIRAFWTRNTPNILWSRSGKEFVGMGHILAAINYIMEYEPDIEFMDGELFSSDTDFSTIQGSVSSNVNYTNEEKTKIKFNVFAIGSDLFKSTDDMQNRLVDISCKHYNNPFTTINFVTAEKIHNTFNNILSLAEEYVSKGYEGIMLRNPDTYYDFKRSDNLLKYKFFNEDDLKLVGMVEGKGKYEGVLGAMVCEGKIDGKLIKTEVGTGFNDDQRKEYWNDRDNLIGNLVEIKYQEISKDSAGDYSLRFPVFLKFKLDR